MRKLIRRLFITTLLLASVFSVGTVYSYFYGSHQLTNTLAVIEPGFNISEKFNPYDYWVPGEKKEKIIWFENSEAMPLLLRFKIEKPVWSISGVPDDAVTFNYSTYLLDSVIWTDGGDGWNYYNQIFTPGHITDPVFDSVTFSQSLSNAVISGAINYTNTYIDIGIKAQTIQINPEAAAANGFPGYSITGETVLWITP